MIGPLQVIEDDHQRAALRSAVQQVGHIFGQPQRLHRRLGELGKTDPVHQWVRSGAKRQQQGRAGHEPIRLVGSGIPGAELASHGLLENRPDEDRFPDSRFTGHQQDAALAVRLRCGQSVESHRQVLRSAAQKHLQRDAIGSGVAVS